MMKKIITGLLSVVLLTAASHSSFSQYFSKLYDYDSTYDWGTSIALRDDTSYFIFGCSRRASYGMMNMNISPDGSTVLSKHIVKQDSVSMYPGVYGEAIRIDNGFLSPLTMQFIIGSYGRSWAGFIKYNMAGDTTLFRTYTDTSANFDLMNSCAALPDGGYLLGGLTRPNAVSYYPALLIRTDSLGDTLWTRTYKKPGPTTSKIVNIIPLNDGRIVIAAMSTYKVDAGGVHHTLYDHNTPWFLVLDSAGNIMRDTLFANCMLGVNNGSLYPDKNGGYIHIGYHDSLFSEYPDNWQNFPSYISHLDSFFRVMWTTKMPYTVSKGGRNSANAHQLRDGNFIVNGAVNIGFGVTIYGWAAKINGQTGKVLWNHIYYSDTNHVAYLTDMVEKPDGSLVFVGQTFSDSLPGWRLNADVWLIGTDSNGCILPGGCDPDTASSSGNPDVIPITAGGSFFTVYPNPANSILALEYNFTIKEDALFLLEDITGKTMVSRKLSSLKKDELIDIDHLPPGLFLYKVIQKGLCISWGKMVKL